MDPLAVKVQSMRWGSGWKRFLVFAELTKSKKKATWIALFVYFQRKGCIRLIAAEGPRQFVNALTLVAVAKAKLIPAGANQPTTGISAIGKFFQNLDILAQKDHMQIIILSSMAFTLVIWIISMIFLILALILYLLFLWHHIQNETLEGFCKRKVETRLERIVKAKTEKIWAKQQQKREAEEQKAIEGGQKPAISAVQRQPTLPTVGGSPMEKVGEFTLRHSDSMATLPPYSSRPQTPADSVPPPLPRHPTLQSLAEFNKPGPPKRSATGASNFSDSSYSSNAPLLRGAAAPGVSSLPPIDTNFRPRLLDRSMTGSSTGSARSFSDDSQSYPFSDRSRPLERSMTGSTAGTTRSFSDRPYTPGQVTYDRSQHPYGPPLAIPLPSRTNTGFSQSSQRNSPLSATTNSPLLQRGRSPITPISSPYDQRIGSPVDGPTYEMGAFNTHQASYTSSPTNYAIANSTHPSVLNPGQGQRRDFSAPTAGWVPRRGPTPFAPQRSATAPVPEDVRARQQAGMPFHEASVPPHSQFHRSQTAGPQGGWR